MVENGIATLTGEVPARWMKRHAEEIAASVSGMRDVRNQLIVDPGVKSFDPAGAAARSDDQNPDALFEIHPVWRRRR